MASMAGGPYSCGRHSTSGLGVYAVWDLALSRNNGALRPYVQITNLGDATYEEVPGVIMPSRSIVAGIEWVLKRTPR